MLTPEVASSDLRIRPAQPEVVPRRPVRVLLCDDRPLVRNGLQVSLAAETDLEVVGAAESPARAISMIGTHRPDVVVTTLRLADSGGSEWVRSLRSAMPRPDSTAIVAYSTPLDDGDLLEVFRAGVKAVLAEDVGRAELVTAVRVVARGQAVLGPAVARRVLDWLQEGNAPAPAPEAVHLAVQLTAREREVLLLTAQGLSVPEVARRLYIGVPTVRTHLYRLRSKLRLRDRAHLVTFAFQAGLMPSGHPHLTR